nr:MAG TPA: hypothetical protein [Caudoviricetes sp.]
MFDLTCKFIIHLLDYFVNGFNDNFLKIFIVLN